MWYCVNAGVWHVSVFSVVQDKLWQICRSLTFNLITLLMEYKGGGFWAISALLFLKWGSCSFMSLWLKCCVICFWVLLCCSFPSSCLFVLVKRDFPPDVKLLFLNHWSKLENGDNRLMCPWPCHSSSKNTFYHVCFVACSRSQFNYETKTSAFKSQRERNWVIQIF